MLDQTGLTQPVWWRYCLRIATAADDWHGAIPDAASGSCGEVWRT